MVLMVIIILIIVISIFIFLYKKFIATEKIEELETKISKILEMSKIKKKIEVRKSYFYNHISFIEPNVVYSKSKEDIEDLIYNVAKICSDNTNFYEMLEEFTYNACFLNFYKKIKL